MTERLLQFIWQHRYYNMSALTTTAGEDLHIINPGIHNTSQGPDFLAAQIRCGQTLLAGSIELHIRASEWLRHGHSADPNYQNCILHVVWENDREINLPFPVLVLNGRVQNLMLDKYERMMQSPRFIPCEEQLHKISSLILTAWKERLFIERLQQRTATIEKLLAVNNFHWEETFWQLLAANFGMKINGAAFGKIAASLPLTLLGKHRNQLIQIEALLLGQAGLLEECFEEAYPQLLQREYRFLQKKYGLHPVHGSVFFLRMRPANFPTLRLAQLAALVCKSQRLFSLVKDADNVTEVMPYFKVTANDFWHYHYRLTEPSGFKEKHLGTQMVENIMLNTVLPIVYAYGWYNNAEVYKEKALQWATQLSPEQNHITKGFRQLKLENKNAFDSQALIRLKNNYCDEKKCLECAVGNSILKSEWQ